jgi:hypothetical protein
MRAVIGANIGLCAAVGLFTTGCSTVPSLPSMGHPLPLAQVVDRVQCEIYETILSLSDLRDDQGVNWVRYYAAKAEITLQVNAEGGAAPEVSLLGPFGTGTYSVGFGAGVTGAATRIAKYGFNLDFMKANEKWCNDTANSGYPPLQGELGMKEWLVTVLRSHNINDPFPRPKSMSHRLDFTLEGSAKISPAYVLTTSKGNGVFSLKRKDFHTLDIALEYLSLKDRNPPDYPEVCVVNLPGPCKAPGAITFHQPPPLPPPAAQPSTKSRSEPDLAPARSKTTRRPGVGRRTPARSQPVEFPRDVQERLDRALQNLELRSIGPRQ